MVSSSRSGSGRQSSTVHCISDPKIATRAMGKNRGGKVDTYMSKDWPWALLIDIAKARRIGNCIRLSVYGKPAELNPWDKSLFPCVASCDDRTP